MSFPKSNPAYIPCQNELIVMLATERFVGYFEVSSTIRIQCNSALIGNSVEKFRLYNLKV
jgi:hypothetical protein